MYVGLFPTYSLALETFRERLDRIEEVKSRNEALDFSETPLVHLRN